MLLHLLDIVIHGLVCHRVSFRDVILRHLDVVATLDEAELLQEEDRLREGVDNIFTGTVRIHEHVFHELLAVIVERVIVP
ncbi:hypothetical protein Bealeia1_00181 [Candidatus Bealeia paramacronuclearis]|uniref:Secreted protein n=1 Tax=Candidatus Bealeia paramacronuclearis TaxID=1921001 RepID=A0ABZ2C1D0_9PROT